MDECLLLISSILWLSRWQSRLALHSFISSIFFFSSFMAIVDADFRSTPTLPFSRRDIEEVKAKTFHHELAVRLILVYYIDCHRVISRDFLYFYLCTWQLVHDDEWERYELRRKSVRFLRHGLPRWFSSFFFWRANGFPRSLLYRWQPSTFSVLVVVLLFFCCCCYFLFTSLADLCVCMWNLYQI